MKKGSIHSLIPFWQLFKLLLGIALVVQLLVITTTHITGYYVLSDSLHFLMRFIFGSFLSLAALFITAYPDLFLIQSLNRLMAWDEHTFLRVFIQTIFTVIIAGVIAVFVTLISHLVGPYQEGLLLNIIYNVLIFGVCNTLLMIILEAWIFFIERAHSEKKSKELQNQLTRLQFETLKSHINSHFMFNSLNVLSGLIDVDAPKAQQFVDEFASIYRYVLKTIEKPVVSLKEELNFARSYMFLQQMRYGDSLIFDVDLPTNVLQAYLPPLSLQVVLENVCKHNRVEKEQPLRIELTGSKDSLNIRNNLQPKISSPQGNGSGQQNLTKRYAMLGNRQPEFRVGTTDYQVTLPLIFEEV